MNHSAQSCVARKVGGQPNHALMRELRRRHPNVKLMWAPQVERWAMIDAPPNMKAQLIRIMQTRKGEYEHPTMANTVYFLDRIHPDNIQGEWGMQRFLRGLDENPEAEAVERRARDQASAGSADLYNAMTRRVITTPKPSTIP
jgi:hypothetical protein